MGFVQKLREEARIARGIQEFLDIEEEKQHRRNVHFANMLVEQFKRDTLKMRALEDELRAYRVVRDKRETVWQN